MKILTNWLVVTVVVSAGSFALLAWWAKTRPPAPNGRPPDVTMRSLFHMFSILATAVIAWLLTLTLSIFKPFVAVVALALIGNIVGTYQRMKDASWEVKVQSAHAAAVQVYLSATVAVILALALVLLFASDLVKGPLFPVVTGALLWNDIHIEQLTKNHFRLLAWCFVAGYLEHFVPSLLARLDESAGNPRDGKA